MGHPLIYHPHEAYEGMTGYEFLPKNCPQIVQYNPTIRRKVPFGPAECEADASNIWKAIKGLSTDKLTLIFILANRPNQQRLLIAEKYNSLYAKDLIGDLMTDCRIPLCDFLKEILSSNFEALMVACVTPLEVFLARELHKAIAGLGTDEATLVEILCSFPTNNLINDIKTSYQEQFQKTLDDDIKGDTSGHFQQLLLTLCLGLRDENNDVNQVQVTADVRVLYEKGEKKIGTNERIFIQILTSRSLPHLRQVFQQYTASYGKTFEEVIKSEFSFWVKKGLLAIVRCANDAPGFFAKRLHKSMVGAGTNDRALIRLVVTRSEVDMADIKVAFEQNFNKTLEAVIKGDTSGSYRKMLLSMVTP